MISNMKHVKLFKLHIEKTMEIADPFVERLWACGPLY